MATIRDWCGKLRAESSGKEVSLYGWVHRRRDHGGLTFIDLRDGSGVVQLVISPQEAPDAHSTIKDVRLEYVLHVEGTVKPRGAENINPNLETGEIEVHATACKILAEAKTPPFPINEDAEVDETLRLKYRYLDLRREKLQKFLRARARYTQGIRETMSEQGFVEIETPMMIRATPEGARDYLVPSRLFHGKFYALPQSPQLYKQLSMVAGFERYFQIARCMRDEDLRADRQPEFTQLDVEMSFVDEEDVFAAVEKGVIEPWNEIGFRGAPIKLPLPRMTWKESMDRFGCDKPDTRFGMELFDLTDVAKTCGFKVFADVVNNGGVVRALTVPGGVDLTRSEIEAALTDVVKHQGAKGLAYLWRKEEGWDSGIAKFFTEAELQAIGTASGAKVGDAVLMVADKWRRAGAALSALRNYLGAKRNLYDDNRVDFLWVTEFPMFEENEETGAVEPAHHPFTQPKPEDMEYFDSEPLKVRSRAYDMVVNGREVASGSIRITDSALQERVFAAIGISKEEAHRKFGFLLEAFQYGAPPHGGCAPGIDRLVMEGMGTDNIRDVIAFPKNQQAQEVMTDAPAEVDARQLKDLGIAVVPGQDSKS